MFCKDNGAAFSFGGHPSCFGYGGNRFIGTLPCYGGCGIIQLQSLCITDFHRHFCFADGWCGDFNGDGDLLTVLTVGEGYFGAAGFESGQC